MTNFEIKDGTAIIPEGTTVIPKRAFYDCQELKRVVIPEGVELIGIFAFYGCSALEEVVIPASVTQIAGWAFTLCPALKRIVVAEGNMVYDSREDCNAIIETESNTLLYGCQTSAIPNGVECIGEYAFQHCTNLKQIAIPESVKCIEAFAFEGCTALQVTIPDTVEEVDEEAFC